MELLEILNPWQGIGKQTAEIPPALSVIPVDLVKR